MPDVKKAELIEGVVCLPSPVSHDGHGAPHADLITWLGARPRKSLPILTIGLRVA